MKILINLARRLRWARQHRGRAERFYGKGTVQWHCAQDVVAEAWNSLQTAKQIYFGE